MFLSVDNRCEAEAAARKSMIEELSKVDSLTLELDREKASNKEMEARLLSVENKEQYASLFEKSVSKMKGLEKEVEKLKDENDMFRVCSTNTRLLEEQLALANQKADLQLARANQSAELEAKLLQANNDLDDLKKLLKIELRLNSLPEPPQLAQMLQDLRRQDHSLTEAIKYMRESISSHEKERTQQVRGNFGLNRLN